jgi:hypothetical protein
VSQTDLKNSESMHLRTYVYINIFNTYIVGSYDVFFFKHFAFASMSVLCLVHFSGQGECVFRLCNFNIVGTYYFFNCATCFGHTTIFRNTYFPRTYSIDNGSVVFLEY